MNISTAHVASGHNIDPETVSGFGDEWSRFDHHNHSREELERLFSEYFSVFPWEELPKDAVGMDVGCGTGRWAQFVAPRVGTLHCIDASKDALNVARQNLGSAAQFHHASLDAIPLEDGSLDFGYSLGVLHHVPDTQAGLTSCAVKLKKGAPFLVYLYYALDNRPAWFQKAWQASDYVRRAVSRMPHSVRYLSSQVLAATVYYPLARTSKNLESIGVNPELIPLSYYRNRSFYVMRNDALDRFGTRLEQRFTRDQVRSLMQNAGLENIRFREEGMPYWCAVGYKA